MKTLFYTNPVFPEKLAFTQSLDPISDLTMLGAITSDTPQLLLESFDPTVNEEDAAVAVFLNCIVFDNNETPTRLVVSPVLLKLQYVDILRMRRESVFTILDRLHITAISKSKIDVAADIESDKQLLRDITDSVNYDNITTLQDLLMLVPAELSIDYAEKYNSRLQ